MFLSYRNQIRSIIYKLFVRRQKQIGGYISNKNKTLRNALDIVTHFYDDSFISRKTLMRIKSIFDNKSFFNCSKVVGLNIFFVRL